MEVIPRSAVILAGRDNLPDTRYPGKIERGSLHQPDSRGDRRTPKRHRHLGHGLKPAGADRRILASEQLRRDLEVVADRLKPDTTSEQMEAAFDDAMAAVRPRRGW